MMDQKMQKAWELAIESNDVDACRVLIAAGVDVNAPVLRGPTALHHAAQYCSIDVCRLLVDSGAEMEHVGKSQSGTPLKVAMSVGRHDIADFLISAGASLTYAPPNAVHGYTSAFQMLVWARDHDLVRQYALKYNVDLAQRTVGGKTLIQMAGGDAEMKELLRSLKTELALRTAVPLAPAAKREPNGRDCASSL